MFDFEKKVNRKNSGSMKWDTNQSDDILPMWVADMDFQTAPAIVEALKKRADHGVFGYPILPEAYYQAEIYWSKKRHRLDIQKEWIQFSPGVVASLSASVKALTRPGDAVLLFSPVYQYFYTSIQNNGCRVVESELVIENKRYTIDFKDVERKIKEEEIKVIMLCNPHNPTAVAWTKEELQSLVALCRAYRVYVVSDEIHRDFIFDAQFHSLVSIDEEFLDYVIVCVAPTKAFNLAGLHVSNMIIPNAEVRKKIDRAQNDNETAEPNIFGIDALIAAYTEGEAWFDALLKTLSGNITYIKEQLQVSLPELQLYQHEATYLLWVDIRNISSSSETFVSQFEQEKRIRLSAGDVYGRGGKGFIRINTATQRSNIDVLLSALVDFVQK